LQLEEIKKYIRVDYDEDDDLITTLQTAAEEYLINAGIVNDYSNKLYKLVVLMLIAHWYENRRIVLVGSISKELEMTLSPIILQLQLKGYIEI